MKKYILTALVVASFISYALYWRLYGNMGNLTASAVDSSGNNMVTNSEIVISAPSSSTQTQTKTSNTTTAKKTVPQTTVTKTTQNGAYKDGTYTGSVADAYFGNVQVEAVIQNGQIADVQFIQYPSDRGTSVRINNNAMPKLKSEAIQAQSANVDIVSGATQTSEAFQQSLASALSQAKS